MVELPSYDPSTPPLFPLSIPDALAHFHSTFPPCTLSSLLSQREEFWHTRVEGDPQMWLVLRAACEAGDEGTCQAMMEGAGLQRWSIEGMAGLFTYDGMGRKYEVPFYCIYTPQTLITEEGKGDPTPSPSASPALEVRGLGGGEGEEGGKTVTFRVRFSDGIGDLPLVLPVSTELRELRGMVREAKGIGEERQIYYLHGHRWVEGTLMQMGLKREMVLQCFVKQQEQQGDTGEAHGDTGALRGRHDDEKRGGKLNELL